MKKMSLFALMAIVLCACGEKPTSRFEMTCSTWNNDGNGEYVEKTVTISTYKNHAILSVDGNDIKLALEDRIKVQVGEYLVYYALIPDSNERYMYRLYKKDGQLSDPFIGFESRSDEFMWKHRYANCKIVETHK